MRKLLKEPWFSSSTTRYLAVFIIFRLVDYFFNSNDVQIGRIWTVGYAIGIAVVVSLRKD